jgi:hypothetical protein
MAKLTFRQVVADVQRMPGLGSCSLGEIIDAVAQAAQRLGNEPWPWNYAETNILVPAPYSTGTVDVVNGTATVTGTTTVWDVSWYGRRMRFGNSNLDYIVSTINSPTSITLAQPVNLTASLSGSTYVIYEDTYLYPADYIFGSDVSLSQPLIRDRILKIPRYRFENVMNAWARSMSTNIQLFYCDHGLDLSNGSTARRYRFRLGPPPAGPVELRLCYHQMAPDFVPGELVTLPEGYDEILGLMAASDLYGENKGKGMGDEIRARAAGMIRLLKRQVASQTIDDVPDASSEVSDSSISQYGMMISRN